MEAGSLVAQDNLLVRAAARMPLNVKRLLWLAMSKITFTDYPKRGKPFEFDVTVADWKKQYGGSGGFLYRDIEQASLSLLKQHVKIDDGIHPRAAVNWLDSCHYVKGEGRVHVVFGYSISVYLAGFQQQYTLFDLAEVGKVRSYYAARLFELLAQFRASGMRVDSVDDLRVMLGVGEKYALYRSFKAKVLQAAVKELNENSSFTIQMKEVKSGREVTAVKFLFSEKT